MNVNSSFCEILMIMFSYFSCHFEMKFMCLTLIISEITDIKADDLFLLKRCFKEIKCVFMCTRKRDEDLIIMQRIMYSKLFIQLF